METLEDGVLVRTLSIVTMPLATALALPDRHPSL
jgi:hypothetical protein